MNKSDGISEIAKALSKFQGEVENPKNTASNPFFNSKYAPLAGIIDATKEKLAKNGLSVVQIPSSDGAQLGMVTLLMHDSGEWIESDFLQMTPDKGTPQGFGSAITYARRYQLSALLGISSEDDDDGNGAEPQKLVQKPSHARKGNGGAPKTPGGATEKSVDYAKSLFVDAGIALGGPPNEDEDKKQSRRDNNKLAVRAWLNENGWELPDTTEDPLEGFDQADISQVIDTLRSRGGNSNE